MDTEAQIREPNINKPLLVIDRVFSTILLVAQPFVAVANFLFVALGESDWMDGTRLVLPWAATTAYVLIFLVPLVAAVFTIVLLAKRRIVCWVPLLAMALTFIMVGSLQEYGQARDGL